MNWCASSAGISRFLCGVAFVVSACEEPSPEPYFQQLSNRDQGERLKAANRLLRFGDDLIPRLVEEVRSDNWLVRYEVAQLLGRLRNSAGVPVLMESLGDRSAAVAQAAAWSLGQIGDPRAVSALLSYTRDPSKGVRQQVLRSIGSCYSDGIDAAVSDSAYAAVSRGLRDSTPKVRIAALEGIRQFGYRGAADQIIRMSRDESPEVRHVAVQALGHIGAGVGPRSAGPPTPRMRGNIVEALVAALEESLQSIRTKSVRSLEMMGASKAVTPLEWLEQRGTEEDKREARRVLEKLRVDRPALIGGD